MSGRLIRTGLLSRRAATDHSPRSTLGHAGSLVVAGLLALALVRDSGPERLTLVPTGFDQLAGWSEDRVSAAVPVFLRSCTRFLVRADAAPFDAAPGGADAGRVGDWRALCAAARALSADDDTAARRFFETRFRPVAVADYGDVDGLFTGYFEIELNGARHRHGRYQTPIYRRPPDLGAAPDLTRARIEDGALAGRGLELFWVDNPIDAFFLQIQGSGRILLHDGRTVRVGYDGQNGQPYVAVGRLLVERGAVPRDKVTMAAIRQWMVQHPKAADALCREDPSYVFFREIHGDGPVGAEHVVLTPERSLAVDPAFVPLGVPIWIMADERFAPGQRVRGLVVAQDTGGAIKGPVRGDFFWGTGDIAGGRAGAMNARGRYYLLLPRNVADRLSAEAAWR